MTTKHRALELADYWMNRKFAIEMADETSYMLRTIPALETEIVQKQKQIELHKNAHHQAILLNNELVAEIKDWKDENKLRHDIELRHLAEIHALRAFIENLPIEQEPLEPKVRRAQSNCNGFCGEYECKETKTGCKRMAQK